MILKSQQNRIELVTRPGKKLGCRGGLVVLSSMASGRPRLVEVVVVLALWRGRCLSCILQLDLQEGPRMITVTLKEKIEKVQYHGPYGQKGHGRFYILDKTSLKI